MKPIAWIPTLYVAEALPYVAVMTISVIMYSRMGLGNAEVAFYTSWLYLPWVIKPFWGPVVDMLRTKRWWILAMQLLVGAGMAGVAFTLEGPSWLQFSLAFFCLMAFSSATHDIAADGFYMQALTSHEQSLYVGWRSTFYRLATLLGSSVLVGVAAELETYTRNVAFSWSLTFHVMAGMFMLFWLWHRISLPADAEGKDKCSGTAGRSLLEGSFAIFGSFFRKPQARAAIAFMLLYRLPEALLVKICPLFLLGDPATGGLGLSTGELAQAQGTVGVIGLTAGGIIGGMLVARKGLKYWLWPMVAAITVPDVVYVWMSHADSPMFAIVNICIFVEQFGYGFGFTAYMLYLMYYSRGEHQTAHYAFCTGLMALSMMVPGMFAGYLQETLGYSRFFMLVMALCLVTAAVSARLEIDPEYGLK